MQLQFGCGIAANYPNDVDIATHKSVILHEDFTNFPFSSELDSTKSALCAFLFTDRWNSLRIETHGSIDPAEKSLKLTLPANKDELSLAFWQWLDASVFTDAKLPQPMGIKTKPGGYDELYLRYYQKFDENYDCTGSNHCGPNLSARYNKRPYGQASPGVKSDGYNKMLVSYEFWRGDQNDAPPGRANFYVYHPLQGGVYGDHLFPTGQISVSEGPQSAAMPLSPNFVPRPDFTPERGRWYCYEFCVKLNTVGENGEIFNDGRITAWVDGEILMDFPNLALRYTSDLKLDDCIFGLHAKESSQTNTIWYKGIVLATEYIGPICGGATQTQTGG